VANVNADALLAAARHGALATLLDDGTPYASLVACAAVGGEPVFLLSALAEHTKNLRRDPRASLLIVDGGEGDAGDPLAHGRATLVGRCAEAEASEVSEAYLAAHPEAAPYLAMKDFRFYRLRVEAVRTIAGFGVMGWKRGGPSGR
jgi:putative heme iron utilization protein